MFGLSPGELIIILVVVVLLFGARRLPELGSSLGQAIQNFRKAFRDAEAIDVSKIDPAQLESDEKKQEAQSSQK